MNIRIEPGASFNPQDSLVRDSSSKLIRAYNLLLAAYPGEGEHNKSAFRQHLCALDLI